jgi:TPR repeat protein
MVSQKTIKKDQFERDPFLCHALDLIRRGHWKTASRILHRIAKAGNADAAAHLGWLTDRGLGIFLSDKSPSGWYETAAKGGSAFGALQHAREIAPEHYNRCEESAEWYAKGISGLTDLAEKGDAESQFQLWAVYDNGLGVTEDRKLAVKFLRSAAGNNHPDACFHLGFWYWELPERTEAQRRRAITFWRRAAKLGSANAQYFLGAYYATDPDMPINAKESARYYTMAALNGDTEALYNLGVMHLVGEGVEVDEARGNSLILEAGRRGNYLAYCYLVQAYELGAHGLPVDLEEAAYWKSLLEKVDEGD